jgi:hypothetical protein
MLVEVMPTPRKWTLVGTWAIEWLRSSSSHKYVSQLVGQIA